MLTTILDRLRKQKTEADQTIADQVRDALKPSALPDPTDPDIIDAINRDNVKARKRKGRASTLIAGKDEMNQKVDTLVGGSY